MSYTLKAGTYIICDPCYVVEDEKWDEVCDSIFSQDVNMPMTMDITHFCESDKQLIMVMMHTDCGDGVYDSNINVLFPVDAGLIAAVPIEACNKKECIDEKNIEDFGTIVTFDNDDECWYDDGTIHFGHVSIYTKYFTDDGYYDDNEND